MAERRNSSGEGSAPPLRLDVPPPPSARIAWPASLGPRFIVLADAEEEFDWTAPFRRDAVTTRAIGALPEANRRFIDHGCTPTYLIDWPVVHDEISAAIIAEMVAEDACDVGSQLHPWVTPPFDEDVTAHNSYTGNLPVPLQAAKLAALTERIAKVTGRTPKVYRAGRYGVGPATAGLLLEQGYRLDCSVRPAFDYSAQGGPDFGRHPIWPWRVGSGLFALPLTTAYTGALRRRGRLPRRRFTQGMLARTGLLDRIPLTPEGVRLADALNAIAHLLDDGHMLFSFSFHTPSVVPGHTPYVRDAADLRTFWGWWDGVFAFLARRGVTAIRSDALIEALETASP